MVIVDVVIIMTVASLASSCQTKVTFVNKELDEPTAAAGGYIGTTFAINLFHINCWSLLLIRFHFQDCFPHKVSGVN